MNSPKTFDSKIKIVGDFKSGWMDSDLKIEPMFFNSGLPFAYRVGGPITRAFIDSIPEGWEDAVFDSRVHMLMPGWFPAIPGWHHDDVPRPRIAPGEHFINAGQPDYDNPRYSAQHIMGLVNAEVCPTYFAIGECKMSQIPDGELIYRTWHKEIEHMVKYRQIDTYTAENGKLIYFNADAFHTGQKCKKSGWRWFGRLSRNTDRQNDITNEVRRQVQVYLEFPMEGW